MKNRIIKRLTLLAVIVALALAGASCNRSKKSSKTTSAQQEKFKIEKIENFKLNNLTSCELQLLVTNGTRVGLSLESGRLDIFYNKSRLGTITADAEVIIPKKATSSVTLPLSLAIDNPLAIYSVYGKLQRGDVNGITLSLTATVKAAGQRRTIERQNIPLATVLSMFGVEASNLPNLLKF